MAAITHICTHCGYEGKPIRPPNDDAPESNDVSKALARIANMILPGSGLMIRPLALFISLPIRLLLWPLKRHMQGGPKHCPNCGLPLMVTLKSDAGWLAKRKEDIKAGLKFDQPEAPVIAFGKEIILPGDEKEKETVAPAPTSLPSLDALLEEEEKDGAMEAPPDKALEETVAPAPRKKPVDPDQW